MHECINDVFFIFWCFDIWGLTDMEGTDIPSASQILEIGMD